MITVLSGGRLLDCVGDEPMESAAVIIEDDLIKEVVPNRPPSPDGARIIDVGGRTIMPGLTDAHQHFAITHVDVHQVFSDPPIVTALNIKGNLERTLQGGFTTVADMGLGHWSVRKAVEDGLIKGPRLLLACGMLSKTGGHADFCIKGDPHILPIKDAGLLALPRTADGVDECLKAVREQFRTGADHIKVMGTGGGASPNDTPWDMGFSAEEMTAICREAAEMKRRVASHCLNNDGARRSIECGVTSVDHGTYMTEETVRLMIERGTFLVPTITILYMLHHHGREWGMQDYLARKTEENQLLQEQMKVTELAHRLGATIASASDAFGQACGQEGHELKFKVECGLSPIEAIKSATIVNARLFGLADKMGTVEPGKWADLIVVDGRPEADAGLFSRPDNVRLVLKAGQVMKNTL